MSCVDVSEYVMCGCECVDVSECRVDVSEYVMCGCE